MIVLHELQLRMLSLDMHVQMRHGKIRQEFTGSMSAGVWLHGEAVAAGTVMAADMSHRLGWIDQELLDRTRHLLERAKLPVAAPQVRLTSYYILAAVSPGLLLGT